jgi:MoaA/NifB/PqqE/SkfB family radical SAM enzyme
MHLPVQFNVRTTNSRCNAHCWFCGGIKKSRAFPTPDMDVAMVQQVLEYYPSIQTLWVGGYGETLLGKDVVPICELGLSLGKKVSVVTNGIRIARMKDTLPWPQLTTIVSLNECDRQRYIKAMGVDKLDEVTAGLEYLRSLGAPFRIKFVVGKNNLKHLPEYIRFCAHFPEAEVLFGTMSDYTGGTDEAEWEQYALFDDDFDALAAIQEAGDTARNFGLRISWPRLLNRGTPVGGCTAPMEHITVDGAGNVGACCKMISVGGSFQTMAEVGPAAWYAEPLEKLRAATNKGGPTMPKECWRCVAR